MVNKLNLIEQEFSKEIKKSKILLEVKNSIKKENCKLDLTKLISCSKNYYEDMIKVNFDNEIVLQIKNNQELNLKGSGNLYLLVEKDSDVLLNFNSKENSFIFIKILVKENVKFNLIDNSNSKNLWKHIDITLEENSNCSFTQFLFNCRQSFTQSNLEKNSRYQLNSAYYIKSLNSYIYNISRHIEENSISSMEINGCVNDDAKIMNNTNTIIEEKAKKSKGNQSMKNLILDENSSIDSKPVLEIKNNDVICSHGSSISQVKDDILFYVNSRGLAKEEATKIYVEGFFNQVLDKVPNQDFKNKINIENV